ncbi:MAG TPA: mandelate racemase, partial [Burkholderiales bacterium]|nr:mandelate racemase [Burkholderiales bacterium]
CCAAPAAVHLEYFHDHVRIERMLFEGFREPKDGAMAPDRARPGLGIELRTSDAERFRL